jgi:hypothetical protein
MRRWTGSRPSSAGANGVRMNGKAIASRLRTDTAYGITTTSYDVQFLRGQHSAGWYQVAGKDAYGETYAFQRIRLEMEAHGFNHPHVKYLVYADVTEPNPRSTLAMAEVNGNLGVVWARNTSGTGTVNGIQWGCATKGDTAALHEVIHMWGVGHEPAYTTDLMYATVNHSLSGRRNDGTTGYPVTVWDAGADTYTSRVLSFPAYLNGSPGSGYRLC